MNRYKFNNKTCSTIIKLLINLTVLLAIITWSDFVFAGHWFSGQYKDGFGDPSVPHYISYQAGSKRIVATKNGKVIILIKGNKITDGKFKMKNSKGEVFTASSVYRCGRSGIALDGYSSKAAINFLKESQGRVKVLLKNDDVKYLFNINANGFNDSWKHINQ